VNAQIPYDAVANVEKSKSVWRPELIPGLAACVAAKQASCLKAQYAEMLTKLSLSTFCECKLKGTDDTSWKKVYESCGKTKSEKCIVDKSTASASCRNQIVQDRIKDYKFMAASAKDRGATEEGTWLAHCAVVDRSKSCLPLLNACVKTLLPPICAQARNNTYFSSKGEDPNKRTRNQVLAQACFENDPVEFYDWVAPARAKALLEIDVGGGGKTLSLNADVKLKKVKFPEGGGLSVMDIAAALQPDGKVHFAASFRVEKSTDWTGCACVGTNITAKVNQAGDYWDTNLAAHSKRTSKRILKSGGEAAYTGADAKGLFASCKGGQRKCSNLWFHDSKAKASMNSISNTSYRRYKVSPMDGGCKIPPAIVLPVWRMAGRTAHANEGVYYGGPSSCDADCEKYRSVGSPLDKYSPYNKLGYPTYGCSSFTEHGSPVMPATGDADPTAKPRVGMSMQPIGFLSKLGAEYDKGGAHLLVVYKGTIGQDWNAADRMELALDKKPRSDGNLAMASYPFVKLFSFKESIFMLQVPEAGGKLWGAAAPLKLEQVKVCGDKLHKMPVANVHWPADVLRRMDFTCAVYDNEDSTLIASSPNILFNSQYNSSMLIISVKNSVYKYPLDSKSISPTCGATPTAKDVNTTGRLTRLTGQSIDDPKSTVASAQYAIDREMMYVHSSYNVIESVDLSLAIPCGRVRNFTQQLFADWKVEDDSAAEMIHKPQLRGVDGTGDAEWTCKLHKQVKVFKGAKLKKHTMCCYPSGGSVTCCVDKDTDGKPGENGVTATAKEMKIALGAL